MKRGQEVKTIQLIGGPFEGHCCTIPKHHARLYIDTKSSENKFEEHEYLQMRSNPLVFIFQATKLKLQYSH